MNYRTFTILMLASIHLLLGCGQDALNIGTDASETYSGPILIWNLSQFELLEIYTHSGQGFNNNGTNQFDLALQPDETAVIQWTAGELISVVREKTQGGFLLGLTTQRAPSFTQAMSVLIVFDDGFRALSGSWEAYATPGFPGFPEEILTYQPNSGNQQPSY